MAVPNVHISAHPPSAQEVWAMIVAYRLPLFLFVAATTLAIGYNGFFLRLVHEARGAGTIREAAADRVDASVPVGAVASLLIGDLLLALMYCSLARAIFTCAGYVRAEPWRCVPQSDPVRQQTLRDSWMAQRRLIHEQGTAVREHQQQQQQQQQMWQAYQAYLAASSPPLPAAVSSDGVPFAYDAGAAGGLPSPTAPLPQRQDVPQGGVLTHSLVSTPADAAATVGAAVAVAVAAATGVIPNASRRTAIDTSTAACTHSSASGTGTFSRSASSAFSPHASADGASATLSGAPSSNSAVASVAAATQCEEHPPREAATPQPAVQALRRLPRHGTSAADADAGRNPHRVFEYEADGSLRFCGVCHLYKPDGSHHCRLCHRCVLDMDHHCPFLNNCVGRRNYKFFFLCIFYSMLCGTVNPALLLRAYGWHPVCQGWGHGWWWVPIGMLAIGAAVSYLWLQHVFLLVRGVSTLDRMTEVAAKRFLEGVTGARRTTCARPGTCAAECGMMIDECITTVVAPHINTLMGRQQEDGALLHTSSTSLSSDEAAVQHVDGNAGPATSAASHEPPTRAERRAQRWALLFGQPQSWVCHLLPLAPVESSHRSGVQLRMDEA